jgi:arsenate reductase
MINVLFLCTGNSARSIMAESYLNHAGRGRFRAFSAGSFPKGEVNPLALETLRSNAIAPESPRSKSWDEFATPSAPQMDLVVTVCDNAAGEVCPIWPGRPAKTHWSFPDPHNARDFEAVFAAIREVIDRLVALPPTALAPSAIVENVSRIAPQ